MAKGRVSIVVEHCKACCLCVEFCPSHVLALSSAFNSKGYHPPHVVHPEKCGGCDYMGCRTAPVRNPRSWAMHKSYGRTVC
jgi:2-oxoglutarate ferredoxin oxidoreductase subunit delta